MTTTTIPIVFMFSGQGSHYYRMGEALYQQHPVFRQTLLDLDEVAQDLLGESIIDILYSTEHKRMDVFTNIRHTHPAIFMVEMALAKTLLVEGIKPDYVLGVSMGAFTAATIAGCWNAEQALIAVIEQADVLRQCVSGGMLAILDNPARYYDKQVPIYTHSVLAAVNFDQHFVVAADNVGLQHVENFLGQDINYQRLAVSHAFHSAWIDSAEAAYLGFLQQQTLSPPDIPLICCMQANVLTQLHTAYFWRVIREPIYFQKTIQLLETQNDYHYIDLGPSGTLATFLKYNLDSVSSSRIQSVMTPYGREYQHLQAVIQDNAL